MKDPSFLRRVQDRGWLIESADQDTCQIKCPGVGCKMRAKLKWEGAIPQRETEALHPWEREVTSYEQIRTLLKGRREELRLTINEVEHAAGLTADHIAKFEREKWHESNRLPNAQTLIEWCQALGIEVILRPSSLPLVTLRIVAETREFSSRRGKKSRPRSRSRLRDRGRTPEVPPTSEPPFPE